jgi:hypothetical protein
MGIFAETKVYPKAPEGVHRAVCYAIYDIGTQEGGNFGPKRQVVFQWELSDEPMEDGRPFAVSETYSLSMNEKANLRKKLEAWRGKSFTDKEAREFDVSSMLGKPCQIQIAHKESSKGGVFANVTAIMALPKGMSRPEKVHNELRTYTITDGEIPPNTPDWIVGKINGCSERKLQDEYGIRPGNSSSMPASGTASVSPAQTIVDDDDDDSIPF